MTTSSVAETWMLIEAIVNLMELSFALIAKASFAMIASTSASANPPRKETTATRTSRRPLTSDEPIENGADRHGLTLQREPSGSVRHGRLSRLCATSRLHLDAQGRLR